MAAFQAARFRGAADSAGGTGWEEDIDDRLRAAAAFVADGGADV